MEVGLKPLVDAAAHEALLRHPPLHAEGASAPPAIRRVPAAAAKAARLALAPSLNAGQAFQAIALNCLAHMQANGQGVAAHDVESVHQMRVGMRRLRSALGMFKALLQLPAELQRDLDWLAGELAAARDWDVLSGATLSELAARMAEPAQLDDLRQAAARIAAEHHASAAAAVGSPRYTRLMLGLARWIHTMGWREDSAAKANAGNRLRQPAAAFARKVLQRNQRRLRSRAAGLRAATPEARHRLRIAAKKTRYAAEFFGSLFAQKKGRAYVKGLTGLQDQLGLLNDAAVAGRLLTELAAAQPQLAASAGYVRGYLAAQSACDATKVARRWKKFAALALPARPRRA